VEATNNRAERALRPQVVLRKIMGTLRNDKGTSIHERIMTTLATWGQRGLNSLQMLTARLASWTHTKILYIIDLIIWHSRILLPMGEFGLQGMSIHAFKRSLHLASCVIG
jgi:hypothetical protein